MTDDCQHGYYKTQHEGEEVFKRYISFFCPDCGMRIPENP